jgi:hypothetical protein
MKGFGSDRLLNKNFNVLSETNVNFEVNTKRIANQGASGIVLSISKRLILIALY